MQRSDNCPVCLATLARKIIIQLEPCSHYFHQNCWQGVLDAGNCPLCRQQVAGTHLVDRKVYAKSSLEDRRRILEAARELRDWKGMAQTLGINLKTAWRWVSNDQIKPHSKKNRIRKALTEDQVENLIEYVASDPSLTLDQMKGFVHREFGQSLCISTISNYLHGSIFSYKKVHYQPEGTNEHSRKLLRRTYVQLITRLIADSKYYTFYHFKC